MICIHISSGPKRETTRLSLTLSTTANCERKAYRPFIAIIINSYYYY